GDEVRPEDVAVGWPGGPTVHVRLPVNQRSDGADLSADLSDGLARLIGEVERELGGPLATLPRAGKQRAVRLLEERGAFAMRRSAETVAEALGVTRFTVYNYLNRAPSTSA
ncbi:MAG: helix-turn-helix domain-containing protein, partial [Lapillicoccus sp.]